LGAPKVCKGLSVYYISGYISDDILIPYSGGFMDSCGELRAYGQFLYDIYAKDDSLSREKHTHIDRRDLIVWFVHVVN
jgi:hypothetical protein